VIALAEFAADFAQPFQSLGALDAFGDDALAQRIAKLHHGAHDLGVARVAIEFAHERAVDLQAVDRKRRKITERRIPGAEVIPG
jgi:hypothetical protein